MKLTKIIAVVVSCVISLGTLFIPMPQDFPTISITASAATKKLPSPENIKASASDGKIILSWDAVDGADGYRIYQYDSAAKKFKKIKTLKGTKSTIKNLKNGKKYYFKVAAVVKKGKSYVSGTTSKKISATPKKPVPEEKTMTAVNVNIAEMKGVWEYYDYRHLKKYTDVSGYNPDKPENPDLEGYLIHLQVFDKKNMYATVNYEEGMAISETTFTASSINVTTFANWNFGGKYKIYSYGEDKYMFLQFINGDGDNTYVYKYKPLTIEETKDENDLEGQWTSVAFCNFKFNEKTIYFPTNSHKLLSWAYLTGINIENGIMTYTYSDEDGDYSSERKLDLSLFSAYKANDHIYMYYYWNGCYYVLVKQ